MVESVFETEYKFEFETENKIFHEYQPWFNISILSVKKPTPGQHIYFFGVETAWLAISTWRRC